MLKSKSYFPKILRDFLITSIVPILAFVLLYFQAESIVKEQILNSNKNTLDQFFELIDTTLKEMEAASYYVANNKLCQEYASYAKKGNKSLTYSVAEIIDVIDGYGGEKYEDFFVYYPGNKRIISGYNGSMNVEDYYSIYYGEKAEREQFFEVVNCDKKRATLHVIKLEGSTPLLCVAMRKTFGVNSSKDYIVVQIISSSYLKKIMTEQYQSEEGTMLIFGRDKQLLVSGDGVDEYHLEGYLGLDEPYETQIGKQIFMMQARKAQSVEGYYAFATPAQYFWETLSNMRLLCILSGIACAIVSVVIAYRGSKRTYSPLWNIVNRIEEHN